MKTPIGSMRAKRTGSVLLVLLLAICPAHAQVEMSGTTEENAPFFYVDLANFRGEKPNASRLDIYLKIMYDELQFIKVAADSYQAVYEVSVIILDEDDFQVNGKIWRDTVSVKDFESTNSRQRFDSAQARFTLPPGKYRISVGVMDVDSRRTAYRKTSLVLRDFAASKLSVSDILIADAMAADSSGKLIPRPQVTAPRQEKSRLFVFFEIYDSEDSKNYEIAYHLKNSKGEKVFHNQTLVHQIGQLTPVALELPNAMLAHGVYVIRLEVKGAKRQATTERQITLHWVGIPTNILDLDQAIEQMRYIAKKGGMKKILSAPPEKRREAFLEFWRENDPTPGTEANELMEEYYRRVGYANAHFGNFREGWKTDMGMVYIIFGPPNDIERNPFNRSTSLFGGRTVKAYEIWNYYDINRQFVFVDETGYGDFRLYYPVSIDQYLR